MSPSCASFAWPTRIPRKSPSNWPCCSPSPPALPAPAARAPRCPSFPRQHRHRRGGGASDSDRAKKMGRVLAVADPRTSSLIVGLASKTLMPQIADMIAELDADKGRKEVVGFYDLQNADPQDVQAALEDLFNRNTRRSSSSQTPGWGINPLTRRATQNTQATSADHPQHRGCDPEYQRRFLAARVPGRKP